ncbi:MAG: site-specific DNA-methyltransferase, partial [Planctomycetes bacterium]|nr:site-specific DNA-methyltransferase [Planctomycetota bacterium]
GQVKCICIDPPYNTGNEGWVYNDNVNSPIMREWLGKVVGKEAEDLSRHDKWLCMMYPRLALLKEFLHKDEGIIFVCIDDNEFARLRVLMDEIFGPTNWLASLTRRAMHTVRNSSKDFNLNTDYVLVYARNKAWLGEVRDRYIRVPMDKSGDYPFDDHDGKGPYKLDPLDARNYYTPYEYTFANGVVWAAPPGRYPAYSQETLAEKDAAGEIVFTGKAPKAKRHLRNVQEGRPPDALLSPEDVGFNSDGTTLLRRMIGGGKFSQPKPVELIKYLLTMIRDPNAIVLDSFAGSGTTGHAVMQRNQEDGGNRRFILIEMEPNIAVDVTAQRIKVAVDGYNYVDERGRVNHVAGLGGGFRYCTLGLTLFDAEGRICPEISFDALARFVFFRETGAPLPETVRWSPLLGVHHGIAVYLLYNGILRDKSPDGGNALTRRTLAELPPHDGPKVIYGTSCRIGTERLRRESVTFRHIPLALRVE